MKLPDKEQCANDPFLNLIRNEDERQFLSQRWGANQRFQARRRICTAVDLMKRHLPDNSEVPLADFACGIGNFGLLLAEQGYQVDMLDNEPKFFDYLRLKMTSGNVNFIHANAAEYVSEKNILASFLAKPLNIWLSHKKR